MEDEGEDHTDGKSFDVFVMTYKSHADAGLREDERRSLEKVLEEELGYRLCLFSRDVLPGEAVANELLRCIEESRRVLLIPTSAAGGTDGSALGHSLPSAIHTALVERKSRLVLIKPKSAEEPQSGPLPESMRLLTGARNSVTWAGPSSRPLSSSFWKQLRYRLPPLRNQRGHLTLPTFDKQWWKYSDPSCE